jgi:hypothetical protein
LWVFVRYVGFPMEANLGPPSISNLGVAF